MAWTDDAAVTQWLERASLSPPLEDFYRRVLVDIRERGFSVPMPAIATPTVVEAVARLREEPNDVGRAPLRRGVQSTDELLLLLRPSRILSQEVQFKTVASPIFDPIGRVLLSISVTGQEEAGSCQSRPGSRATSRAVGLNRDAAGPGTRPQTNRTGEVAVSLRGTPEAPDS